MPNHDGAHTPAGDGIYRPPQRGPARHSLWPWSRIAQLEAENIRLRALLHLAHERQAEERGARMAARDQAQAEVERLQRELERARQTIAELTHA